MTVLVLTCPEDVTADMVVHQLHQAGTPVFRVDPADFPGRVDLTSVTEHGVVDGYLWDGRRRLLLSSIRSVWVRRPGLPGAVPGAHQEWSAHEALHAFYGSLRALPGVRWVNDPEAHERARYKTPQLLLAHRAGLLTPPTLVTTCDVEARYFRSHNGPMVCKTVSGRQPDGVALPTARISPDVDLSSVAGSPTCFQQAVEKIADIRLTVVGTEMFCAEAQCADADVRFTEGVQWKEVPTPPYVEAAVNAFMGLSGLTYGAFDFVVDREGRWWFLECNPGGQFGFIELATGQPISRAIADLLSG
jgi:glutathione synthase/RimK-type ligase-like ATP-grasp enzyme